MSDTWFERSCPVPGRSVLSSAGPQCQHCLSCRIVLPHHGAECTVAVPGRRVLPHRGVERSHVVYGGCVLSRRGHEHAHALRAWLQWQSAGPVDVPTVPGGSRVVSLWCDVVHQLRGGFDSGVSGHHGLSTVSRGEICVSRWSVCLPDMRCRHHLRREWFSFVHRLPRGQLCRRIGPDGVYAVLTGTRKQCYGIHQLRNVCGR